MKRIKETTRVFANENINIPKRLCKYYKLCAFENINIDIFKALSCNVISLYYFQRHLLY